MLVFPNSGVTFKMITIITVSLNGNTCNLFFQNSRITFQIKNASKDWGNHYVDQP